MFSIEDYVNFQYPLTRPYRQRWRYTTHVLLVFACISLVGFAALNVALVGYDVVTVISDNFNASYSASWTLSWDDQIQGCQTHIYQLGDSFRTNNSAFTYSIYNVMSTSNSSGGSGNVQGSFSYANNSLANCDVTSIELNVLPGDRSVGANVAISCPELGFEASTSWGYTNYQPVGALAPSTFAYNSLARATWDVLTGFGSDAYWPIYYGQYVFNGTSPTQLLYRVTTLFTPSNNSLNNEEPSLSISWYNGISLTNLSIVANTGNYAQTVTAGTSTLQNLAQALYASIRLDLGHWTANNILTNKLAYDAVIQPGQSFADSTLNSNTAPAYVNFTSPPAVDVSTPPSVAQMQYTCTIRQMKTGGSMFMSVAAATLAMFLSAWGAITAILSSVARNGPGGAYASRVLRMTTLTCLYQRIPALNAAGPECPTGTPIRRI
ncbi:hypothetical protein CONPUDRAFT_125167 [Coniophora puteana RWD-64-598 SS2]|uniref:Transmembrane protein n=1 Tax=Coniophora puteana (strain RWD-64-598) TaxID=741705 RepID=A0A5M3MN22_CONPW|nr:uncharacterized protein CONPUDRAFT_125167 [Coniophora puteana RWD-64-598 SS2]EIW80410.1 hypothetical protein CONPUDRAFT_125167 [Coniophora puteana RWD-64-598 SS2]